ncbi:molybdopterin-synthase adenylyltransferase MoeB [Aestuariibacter halophilus]|uniref:Molybdopterin-synthase adenylyltransferase MoeB n=1 Tax=Fluctibacter halophilus TaxID=226011 RepID=A0ABS8G9V8_9ALTE|nr:molybdopterin-synthase adenylyltransferase MoeB [Aestuariibacter halophilus]MCC2616590.1 molybdopterin-synthase adenylyltransferase MoeB [Aestuariibacter halophilus]
MSSTLTSSSAMRYNRHIVLPFVDLEGQETWLNARVLIIGLGGLGCASSQYLASSGIGHLTLMDDDRVEVHNLPRQVLFSDNDVGQHKVTVAARRLSALNPDTTVTCHTQRFDEASSAIRLQDVDLVLDCTDNLQTRQAINRSCYHNGVALISAAAIRAEGQLCVVSPSAGPCYQCLYSQPATEQESCVERGVMSPMIGAIGALQAQLALMVLLNGADAFTGRLHCLDGKNLQWRELAFAQQPDCPVCQTKEWANG